MRGVTEADVTEADVTEADVTEADVTGGTYDPQSSLRAARSRYFEANGFGPDGGYDDAWVEFKLGPLPCPFPNTKSRARAVRYHDLHHIITGYATNIAGELEISGWELGAGCRDYFAAWRLNLMGMATGSIFMPRRTFRAFLAGRQSRSLYGEPLDELLDGTVAEARERVRAEPRAGRPRLADYALYALYADVGFVLSLVTLPLAFVLMPVGLLAGLFTRRASPT